MATDAPIPSPFDGLQGILDKIIGSTTKTTGEQNLDINSLLQQLTGVSSNETQNVNTSAQTDALTQLLSSLTGQTSGQTSNTQTTNANIEGLQKVFQQQQAGVTPDMLAAIFREGAKAAPQLISATSNAVGARAGTNSATANALTELNSNLVSQAAGMNQKMIADSANTAAQIAALTKSVTDSGTTQQSTNQSKTDNTSASTTMNQTQALQKLLESMTSMNQTQDQTQQKTDDTTSTTGINVKQTGAAAGLAGLLSLFGAMGSGGAGGTDWLSQLTKLFTSGGGGSTGTDPSGAPIYPTAPYHDPVYDPPPPDDLEGYADGGVVKAAGQQLPTLKLTDTKAQAPSLQQIMALAEGGSVGGSGMNMGGVLSSLGVTGDGKQQIPGNPLDTTSAGGDSGAGPGTGPGTTGSTTSSNSNTNNEDSTNIGFSSPPSLGSLASLGLSAVTGNLPGFVIGLLNVAKNIEITKQIAPVNTPTLTPMNPAIAFDPISPISVQGSDDSIGATPGPGSVTAGPATATDPATGQSISVEGAMGEGATTTDAVGNSTAADGTAAAGDGGGTSGGAGDGTGGPSGGDGWANGGYLQKKLNDMNGVKDTVNIKVSGGEYIVPADVVDLMTPEFFDALRFMHHKPAAAQR